MSSTTRIGWALALLVAWTSLVRLMGSDFGVPCVKEADTFIADHVRMLREGGVKFDRGLSALQYPSLLAEAVAPLSKATGVSRGDETTLDEHLASAAAVWLQVRAVVALLSILIVPATFWIARRFVAASWALFAAALVSFSLLHVFFAQEARAHGAAASFMTLAIGCALWLRREPSWLSYAATTLAAALSIGCLHNGAAVLLPIGVAQILRRDRRWWDPHLLVVAAYAAVSFRIFYWYYFDADAIAAKAGDDGTVEAVREWAFDGTGFPRIARTLWYYEPVLLALSIVALVVWLATRRGSRTAPPSARAERGDVLVVLSFALPYLFVFGMFQWTFERMVLPLLPLFATFAAWGASSLWARLSSAGARRALVAALVGALAVPAVASTKLAWMRSRPSTIDLTAQWLREHVPDPASEPIFVLPPLDFPLFRTTESLRYPPGHAAFFSPWSRYQNKLDDARRIAPLWRVYWLSGKPEFAQLDTDEHIEAYLRSHGPGLFIAAMIAEHQSPERHQLIESLRAHGRLLERISPDGDPHFTDLQLWDQDVEAPGWPNVTWRVLRARAVGPIIEVYRLD